MTSRAASALKGRRGQKFLRSLIAALDAMPVKELVSGEFRAAEGQQDALGAVAAARGVDLYHIEGWDHRLMGLRLDIPSSLVAEIIAQNDHGVPVLKSKEICGPLPPWIPEQYRPVFAIESRKRRRLRWQHMRDWAVRHLITHPSQIGMPYLLMPPHIDFGRAQLTPKGVARVGLGRRNLQRVAQHLGVQDQYDVAEPIASIEPDGSIALGWSLADVERVTLRLAEDAFVWVE